MSRKKQQPKNRSDELRQCENTILEMFCDKHITVSEALFIFEKIKFAAFYSDVVKCQQSTPIQPKKGKEQAMFR